jgi:hypothetical protein
MQNFHPHRPEQTLETSCEEGVRVEMPSQMK